MKSLNVIFFFLFSLGLSANSQKACLEKLDNLCKGQEARNCVAKQKENFKKTPCAQAWITKSYMVEVAKLTAEKKISIIPKILNAYKNTCMAHLDSLCKGKDPVACYKKNKEKIKTSLCAKDYLAKAKVVQAHNKALAKAIATKAARVAKAKAAMKKALALAMAKKALIVAAANANKNNPEAQEAALEKARVAYERAYKVYLAKKAAAEAVEQVKETRKQKNIEMAKKIANMACVASLEAACAKFDDVGKCIEKNAALVQASPCLQEFLMNRMMVKMKKMAACSEKLADMCKGKMDMNQCREKYGSRLDGECRRTLASAKNEVQKSKIDLKREDKKNKGCMKVIQKYCPTHDSQCMLKYKDTIQKNCS